MNLLESLGVRAVYVKQTLGDKLIVHTHDVYKCGGGMPQVAGWRWTGREKDGAPRTRETARGNV